MDEMRGDGILGWIGVDLDRTLAHYDGDLTKPIGEPLEPLASKVLDWIEAKKDVRIFTARACSKSGIQEVQRWTLTHFGVRLPVTNVKDYGCYCIIDDRAISIEPNSGNLVIPDYLKGGLK